MHQVYYRPLIPLLLVFIGGIVLGVFLPGYSGWIYGFSGCVGCLILYDCFMQRHARISPLSLFLALGYLAIQPWIAAPFSENHISHLTHDINYEITGIIVQKPELSGNRHIAIVDAETMRMDQTEYSVSGKIRLTIVGKNESMDRGDRIRFVSKLRAPQNFKNPGGFDFKRHLAFQDIRVTAFVTGSAMITLEKGQPSRLERIRKKIAERIDQTRSGDHRSVLKALIIGDRSEIPHDVTIAFRHAGVGHVLAISGLHVGMIAGVSFFVFKWLLSFSRFLLLHAWVRKIAAILTVFPVLMYGIVAGMSPSTQRASIMVIAFLLTFLIERDRESMNIIAVAGMIILVIHPPALFSISFQLSFAAVISIVYGLTIVSRIQKNGTKPLVGYRRKLMEFCLLSVFAFWGTLPLGALYFNRISLIALAANLIIVPIIGWGVVPAGLIASYVYPFYHLSMFGFRLSAECLAFSIPIIEFLSKLPKASIATVTPSFLEICLYYISGWAILNLIVFKLDPSEKNRKPYRLALCVATIACIIGIADLGYWLNQRYWRQEVEVTVLDAGKGNIALIEFPKGFCMLVDSGGFSRLDMGEKLIAPFLLQKKIKSVDVLMVNHSDGKHLNRLTHIFENFKVNALWSIEKMANTKDYETFIRKLNRNHLVGESKIIDKPSTIHDVKLTFTQAPVANSGKMRSSPLMILEYGQTSFLFSGNASRSTKNSWIGDDSAKFKHTVFIATPYDDVFIQSTSFLEHIHPEYIITSSHLTTSPAWDYKILCTNVLGSVCFSTDGSFLKCKMQIYK